MTELILERFDHAESTKISNLPPKSKRNGGENLSSQVSSSASSEEPPRKKSRAPPIASDDDAAFAARLQAEENARGRTTRGGASGKRATPKKAAKKKSKSVSKLKATDDSDLDTTDGGEKVVNRSGAFHVSLTLLRRLAQHSCDARADSVVETIYTVPATRRSVRRDKRKQDIFSCGTLLICQSCLDHRR